MIAPDVVQGIPISKEDADDIAVELPRAQVVPLDSIEKEVALQPEPEPVPVQKIEPSIAEENGEEEPIEAEAEAVESAVSMETLVSINKALAALESLGRNIPELKKAIAERLNIKYGFQGVRASDVPEKLQPEAADKVLHLLSLTLDKEAKKAGAK